MIDGLFYGISDAWPLLIVNGVFFLILSGTYSLTKNSKSSLTRIIITAVIVVLLGALYKFLFEGSHLGPVDDWDPIYGRSETIVDYNPTMGQRLTAAVKVFILFGFPVILGLIWGLKDRKSNTDFPNS